MPFKFKIFSLFLLTFLIFATFAAPANANSLVANLPFSKSENNPISAQLFNFGEENSDERAAPPLNAGEQEQGGIQGALKGSLLGKLMFNMPFEKASMVDILVLLGLAFMISKLISRANSKKFPGSHTPDERGDIHADPHAHSGPAAPAPGFDPWARFKSKQPGPKKGKTIPFPGTEDQLATNTQAEEFYIDDQEDMGQEDDEFLKGAKMLYVRLHEAWKNKNFEFIQHFTSPQVFEHFQARNQNLDKDDFVDIVKVDAKVLKDELRNSERYVVVEFTALAHMGKQAGPPSELKETWAFLEPTHTGTWRLEEIL